MHDLVRHVVPASTATALQRAPIKRERGRLYLTDFGLTGCRNLRVGWRAAVGGVGKLPNLESGLLLLTAHRLEGMHTTHT